MKLFEEKRKDENTRNFKGKFVYKNGDTYEGDLVNGRPNGNGVQNDVNGHKYVGHFADGEPDGKGKLEIKNGDTYEGIFSNGLKTGEFVVEDIHGRKYYVEFDESKEDVSGLLLCTISSSSLIYIIYID